MARYQLEGKITESSIRVNGYTFRGSNCAIFSLPGRSPGRAVVLSLASALALAKSLTLKFFI